MMRIGLDMISAGAGFSPGAGGMIPYYEGLPAALCANEAVDSVVAIAPPWSDGLALPDHHKLEIVRCRGLPHARAGRVLFEQTVLPVLAARTGVDVLLSTCNVRPFLWRGPSVVVLQSIQRFLFPHSVSTLRGLYLTWAVPRSLRRADMVIAVTETERADALNLFGLDPDRIRTVYNALPPWVRRGMRAHPEKPAVETSGRPYILAVSRLYAFKNYGRLIEAFARVIRQHNVPHALVIAGGDADVSREELQELAVRLHLQDRVHLLGAVPEEELPRLFAHSDAVAYVSLYETFGLPVLEALAFGRPLLTSGTGATAEVAGDAARLVDPNDVHSIAAGLADVLLDDDFRRALSEAGPRRAELFTWERCASGSVEVMERAIRERHGRSSEPPKPKAQR